MEIKTPLDARVFPLPRIRVEKPMILRKFIAKCIGITSNQIWDDAVRCVGVAAFLAGGKCEGRE